MYVVRMQMSRVIGGLLGLQCVIPSTCQTFHKPNHIRNAMTFYGLLALLMSLPKQKGFRKTGLNSNFVG